MKVLIAIIFLHSLSCALWAQSPAYDAASNRLAGPAAGYVNIYRITADEMTEADFKNEIITGGFQQYKNINIISIPEADSDLEENYFVYPHPILNNMVLSFEKMKTGSYTLEVYDISEKILVRTKLKLKKQPFLVRINFTECANGVYLIKIKNAGNLIEKAFRVIK